MLRRVIIETMRNAGVRSVSSGAVWDIGQDGGGGLAIKGCITVSDNHLCHCWVSSVKHQNHHTHTHPYPIPDCEYNRLP